MHFPSTSIACVFSKHLCCNTGYISIAYPPNSIEQKCAIGYYLLLLLLLFFFLLVTNSATQTKKLLFPLKLNRKKQTHFNYRIVTKLTHWTASQQCAFFTMGFVSCAVMPTCHAGRSNVRPPARSGARLVTFACRFPKRRCWRTALLLLLFLSTKCI